MTADTQPAPVAAPAPAAAAQAPPPTKTPMYEALNAQRYLRQAQIRDIQQRSGSRLLCYVAGVLAPITRDDTIGLIDLLHNVPRDSNIDLLLHTPGGDVDAAEKLVSILRTTVGTSRLRVIVPDFAKSAGTLIALAADKIVMSEPSELGPIDPQVTLTDGRGNALQHSVLNYLDAYKTHCATLRTTPTDVPAAIMLSKIDPATVVLFEAVKSRARKLAEEHLNRWMFHQKKATYTKIAGDLMDPEKWPAHGQHISWEDAKQLELEVEYVDQNSDEWRAYWRLYCQQRLAIEDNEKLFESDYASLPMRGPTKP